MHSAIKFNRSSILFIFTYYASYVDDLYFVGYACFCIYFCRVALKYKISTSP